ncbi:MAG: lipocalin family protein [Candidatus Latescibacterota bacterium]|nr:lipocalin family protein [Candidatus Latescibacterota bacterium]
MLHRLLLLGFFIVSACGDDEVVGPARDLVGTWQMVSESSGNFDLKNITVTLTFKKSGKLSGVFDAGTLSTPVKGDWYISSGYLVMEVNIGGIIDVTTFEYTIEGDTLTTVSYDGTIEVYQRQ